MTKKIKSQNLLEQNSFLKGLLIGIGTTTLIAGIGSVIAYRFLVLKRDRSVVGREFYEYTSEGNIAPDSDLPACGPRFKSETNEFERDFDLRIKEFEDLEEATKNLRDRL